MTLREDTRSVAGKAPVAVVILVAWGEEERGECQCGCWRDALDAVRCVGSMHRLRRWPHRLTDRAPLAPQPLGLAVRPGLAPNAVAGRATRERVVCVYSSARRSRDEVERGSCSWLKQRRPTPQHTANCTQPLTLCCRRVATRSGPADIVLEESPSTTPIIAHRVSNDSGRHEPPHDDNSRPVASPLPTRTLLRRDGEGRGRTGEQ